MKKLLTLLALCCAPICAGSAQSVTVDFANRNNSTQVVAPGLLGVVGVGSTVSDATAITLLQGTGLTGDRIFASLAGIYSGGSPSYTLLDAQITRATNAGFGHPLLVLTDSPPALGSSGCSVPSNVSTWASDAAAVVAHLDAVHPGVVRDYEIWNEPDSQASLCAGTTAANLTAYLSIYAAAGAAIRTQAIADQATVRIGGPTLAAPANNLSWITSLTTTSSTYPYVDFVSLHIYVTGQSDITGGMTWTTLYNKTQSGTQGFEHYYQAADALVRAGSQHNAATTPIFITEYNANNAFAADCCRSDPTYGPLWNTLAITDALNAGYSGASQLPAKLHYFAASASAGYFCLVGLIDSSMDCSPASYSAYPQYYAYQLFAARLALEGGAHMAAAVSPASTTSGISVTAFYTASADNVVVVNPTASATTVNLAVTNGGLAALGGTMFVLNATNPTITAAAHAVTAVASGYTSTMAVPAYSTVALSVTGVLPSSSGGTAAPVISPAAGSYASTQSVTVTDASSGADIFCSTDGSTPTPESPKYTGPITVSSTTIVQCMAAVAGIRRNNIQNDDPNAAGTYWKAADYINGGGSGIPTGLNHSSGHATPSLSGASMEFSMTAHGAQTNVLWAPGTGFGKCDTCSYELFDYQLYLDPGVCTNNGTTEQDDFKIASSLGSLRYMGGAQWRRNGCTSGHACLDIGGNSNVSWTFTGVNIPLACGTFHHLQRAEHFVPAEVTSKPCVDRNGAHWPYFYEDYWIVDGTRYDNGGAGWKFCANGVNWPSWNAPQFQEDATNGTHTMYLDQANFVSYFPGSGVSSNAYTITGGTGTPTAATPAITPGGGFYTTAQTVTLSDPTPGGVIHYTTDGSTPNASSSTYSSALSITTTTTVKAIAIASGYNNSSVASAVYSFSGSGGLTATPTFSPTGGSYATTQYITISDGTSGAVIYYTTDGSTPTTSSNVYSVPLAVTATATIKVMAVAPGLTNSSVASATYTITTATPVASTPTFSPLAGSYTATQTVTIADSTPSSTIYYTIDGSTPTTSSTVYSSALTVSATTTVKAIASASGFSNSAVGTALYTIGCGATPLGTGNIDVSQIKPTQRLGVGTFFQMATGPFTLGHAAVYDCVGDLVDGGVAPSGANSADGEVPSGTVNGSNVTFTLAHAPSPASSLKLYFNGLRQRLTTDYTLSGTAITFTTAPDAGGLLADYRY
jgi:hypothetical protein